MVAVAVDLAWRDQAGQALEQLEGREDQRVAALEVGLGEAEEEPRLGRGEGALAIQAVEPLQGEGAAGAIPHERLHPCPVRRLDAHGDRPPRH